MGASQAMGSASQMEERYFLQKVKLGQGSFGTVYRAVDRKSEELVAIKQLDKRALPQRGIGRQQVNKEIAILRTCAHMNVTELHGAYEDANCIYLALEYCDGGDFADKVKEKGLAVQEGEAADWVLQMCEAVAAIHSKGVCHRDIKPDNFMIKVEKTGRPGGMLKLTDFGLATEVPRGALLFEQCGTPPFMAPELHALPVHRQGYGFPVDVWATGVSMYCVMFGGRHPFTNTAGLLDLRLLCQASMDFREPGMKGTLGGLRFSDEARQLCRWMVAVDPVRRMSARDACVAAAAWVSKTPALLQSRGPDRSHDSRPGESSSRPATPQPSRSRSVSFDEFGASGGPMASRPASLDVSTVVGSLLPRSDSFWALLGQQQQSVPAVEEVEELDAQCKDLRSRAERCAPGDLLPAAELKGAEALCRALQQRVGCAASDVEAREKEVQDLQARLGRTEAQCRELREQRDRADRELARKAEDLARVETAMVTPHAAAGRGGAGEKALIKAESRCVELQRLVTQMEADAEAQRQEVAQLREASRGAGRRDRQSEAAHRAEVRCAALQERAERSEAQRSAQAEELSKLREEHAQLQRACASTAGAQAEELSKAESRGRALQARLQRADASVTAGVEALREAERQCSQLKERLASSEADVRAATEELQRERAKAIAGGASSPEGGDAARDRAAEELRRAQALCQTLRQWAERTEAEATGKAEELRREKAASLQLRQRVEALEAAAGDSSKELTVLRSQSRELQSQLARRGAEAAARTEELERAKTQCKELSERVVRAEADAAASQEELQAARGLCQDLREQVSRQEADCRAAALERRQAEARCRQLCSEVSQKEMQATVARQDVHREQSRCQELEERLEAMRTDLLAQTASAAAKERELGRRAGPRGRPGGGSPGGAGAGEPAGLAAQCQELLKQNGLLEAHASDRARELREASQRLAAAEERRAALEAEASRLQDELRQAQALAAAASEQVTRHEGGASAGADELRAAKTECRVLREQVALRDADARTSSAELARLRLECQELIERGCTLGADVAARDEELQQLRAQCCDLRGRLEDAAAAAADEALRLEASQATARSFAEQLTARQPAHGEQGPGGLAAEAEEQALELQRSRAAALQQQARIEELQDELARAGAQLEQAGSQAREEQDLREQLAKLEVEAAEHKRVRLEHQEELAALRKGWLAPAASGPPAAPGAAAGAAPRAPGGPKKGRFRLPQALRRRAPRA